MPVRSLGSSVLKWPTRAEVEAARRAWAESLEAPGVLTLGYFGSYARDEAGVGSDLDLVPIVESSGLPPPLRPMRLPLEARPVPAEALVFTRAEWAALMKRGGRFAEVFKTEARWLFGPP